MISEFKKVDVKTLSDNVFKLLDNDWMLITAGTSDSVNTMTASWGGFGILWNKPVAFIVIRPQRYTLGFVENNDSFTLSFFTEEFRSVLQYCGKKSGRDTNKIKESNLTPMTLDKSIAFEQACMVLHCRKLYTDSFKPENFIDKDIVGKIYPTKDFHHFFIAEIIDCYKKELVDLLA